MGEGCTLGGGGGSRRSLECENVVLTLLELQLDLTQKSLERGTVWAEARAEVKVSAESRVTRLRRS